jgi:16S rRNA (uracil1498-N3)-methyltransferase
MHRFLLEQRLDKDLITIKDRAIVHQIKTVLKMRKGEKVAFFNTLPEDAGTEFIAELKNIEGATLMFLVREKFENRRESTKRVTLFCSLPKKEKFEWVLQKGTEIGVQAFVPILSVRSEKKNVNITRCETILKEAAEQSGRAYIPKLYEVTPFDQAVEFAKTLSRRTYFAHVSERDNMIRGAGDRTVNLFIGPEGGWDEKEVFAAIRAGFDPVSLGRLTLRAETAAITASYALLWV